MLELFEYSFFTNALLAGFLSAIAAGIIGTFVVIRKISFISGSIAHASFGGLGLAYFLGWNPLLGTLLFGILTALGIGVINRKSKTQEDASIGALWAVGMAVGLFFIYLSPGYAADLFSYLFGNILLVRTADLWMIGTLNLLIIGSVTLSFKWLVAFLFDEEFAEVTHIPTFSIYLFLLILIALSVVLLIKTVGVILMIALLTLPSSTAQLLSERFKPMIFLSIGFAAAANTLGVFLSYYLNLPAGPVIVFVAAIAYLGVRIIRALHKKI